VKPGRSVGRFAGTCFTFAPGDVISSLEPCRLATFHGGGVGIRSFEGDAGGDTPGTPRRRRERRRRQLVRRGGRSSAVDSGAEGGGRSLRIIGGGG
jgi:hypothetical protein